MKKLFTIFILIVSIFSLIGCVEITPEEQAKREQEQQEYKLNHTYHFPVISVFQYLETRTNGYGAIKSQQICYSFIWKDAEGQIHQTDNYKNLDYGLTKIQLGEVDEFVVYDYGETHSCLFLTEESFNKMNKIN